MEDSLDAWATSITSIPLRHPNANKKKRKKCGQRPYFRPGHEHSSSLGCIIEADNEDCCSSIRTTDTSRSAASRKKRHTQNSEASLANIIYEDEDDDEDDDDVHRQLISAKALEVKINDMVNEMAEQRKELEALRKENKLLMDALGLRDKIPAAASATPTTTATTTTTSAATTTATTTATTAEQEIRNEIAEMKAMIQQICVFQQQQQQQQQQPQQPQQQQQQKSQQQIEIQTYQQQQQEQEQEHQHQQQQQQEHQQQLKTPPRDLGKRSNLDDSCETLDRLVKLTNNNGTPQPMRNEDT